MFRKMLPILFFLFLGALIFSPPRDAQAQVTGPGTVVPVIELEVEVSQPAEVAAYSFYSFTVAITNTGAISAEIFSYMNFNYTEIRNVFSPRELYYGDETGVYTSTADVHFVPPLEPGESFYFNVHGYQPFTGPVWGSIDVLASDPNGLADNSVKTEALDWVAGYPTDLSIDGHFTTDVTAGTETTLHLQLSSVGQIAESRTIVSIPELWGYTGKYALSHSEQIVLPNVQIRAATAENASAIVDEFNALKSRWQAYSAATGNMNASAELGDPPLVTSVEGSPLIFWTPFDQDDTIGVDLILKVNPSEEVETVKGRISVADGDLFQEDSNNSNNFFTLQESIDFIIGLLEIFLPLIAR